MSKEDEGTRLRGFVLPVYANNAEGIWGVAYVLGTDCRDACLRAPQAAEQERSLCFWLGGAFDLPDAARDHRESEVPGAPYPRLPGGLRRARGGRQSALPGTASGRGRT